MASTIYIMEGVNLFCGDDDPTNSKHLTLESLKLPDLQESYTDHMPGGAPVGIELSTGVEKLESTFKLKGFDMPLLRQFGLGSRSKYKYTAYGAVRDKRSGALVESMAVFEARLGRIAGDEFSKGETMSHEYALNEITHYEFHMNGAEEFYWDFWSNVMRVGGAPQNADLNRILRIPN